MKVTGFVGSPRINGNTNALVEKVLEGAKEKGAETKIYNLNAMNFKGCQACYRCRKTSKCEVQDDMQILYKEILESDGIVIGSPIYMGQITGQIKLFLDRFHSLVVPNSPLAGKKLIVIYSQEVPDKMAFQPYFEIMKKMYDMAGFELLETVISIGSKDPKTIIEDADQLEHLKELGARMG